MFGPSLPFFWVHAQRPMERLSRAADIEGVDAQRRFAQFFEGPGFPGEHQYAGRGVEQRTLLGHQIEAVAHGVDQEHIGDGQRGHRTGPVVLDVQHDGCP